MRLLMFYSAKGGFSYEDYGRRTIDNTIPLGEAMWMSGNGASLATDKVIMICSAYMLRILFI